MGYVLLILLGIELYIFYNSNGKNIISPSFLGGMMFILSTTIYLSADEYFGYEIHFVTVLTIIGLLACIFIGERFAERLIVKKQLCKIPSEDSNSRTFIEVPRWVCLFITIGVLAMSLLHFRTAYLYSLTVGNTAGNVFTMAKYIREASLSGKGAFELPILISQGLVFSECIVWFCVYSICNNKNITGKFYYRLLFPIIAYLPNVWATDNRTSLLRMVAICFIIVFVFIKQKHGWTKKGNTKIVFFGVLVICLYLVVFRMLGYRTETSLRNELGENLIEYMSASLVGLDKYLLEGEPANTLFGEGTLKGIYNILRQWGLPIPMVDQFEPFYSYAGGMSNAYTTFKAYIHDYSIVGAIVAMFLWGAIINYSMKYIRENNVSFVRMCVVGMMFYPVVMLSIADSTAVFLSMKTVYTLVYLFVIDMILVKKKVNIK